jgi:hypothetical protein
LAPSDKPGPVIDLSTIEDGPKRGEKPELLTVKIGERMIPLRSTEDLDWQVVADLSPEKPKEFIWAIIEDNDDLDYFFEQKITTSQLRALLQRYAKHYGLLEPGKPTASQRR